MIDDISMEIFHGPVPPSVTSFTDDGDNTTTFTLTFDTDVSGVDASDFTFVVSGNATATGVSVSGGPAIYTVTVDGLADDGGVTVTLLADGTITSDGNGAAFDAPGRTSVTSPSQIVGSGIPGLPSLQVPFIQQ
ncbi:MAG: hypothetical protein IID09_06505 [Candidatus Hydrogenedentes bacterium]|nr:hypothetical protein [Candidatus Hydrogenedentota bacterium]